MWYGAVRFVVESLKADNWLFFGVPTAQIIAAITVIGAAVILAVRHARPPADEPLDPPDDTVASALEAPGPTPLV